MPEILERGKLSSSKTVILCYHYHLLCACGSSQMAYNFKVSKTNRVQTNIAHRAFGLSIPYFIKGSACDSVAVELNCAGTYRQYLYVVNLSQLEGTTSESYKGQLHLVSTFSG